MLNVDSQASFDNILINVIGEISNKSEPSRKFVQTFVLAEQPNGYYVLNDIFRYLTEEEEEVPAEEAAPAAEQQQEAPQAPAQSAAPEAVPEAVPEAAPVATESQVDNEPAATKVDEKLEEAKPNGETAEPTAAPQTNGNAEPQEAPAAPAPAPAAEAESTQPEYPPSPEPTPTASAPKEAPAAEKEAPAAPAKALPKTWANIASKPGAAVPVVPAIPVAPPKAPATSSAQAATPAQPQPQPQPQPQQAAPAAESTPNQPSSNDTSGWQTAGHEHKKTQSRVGEENVLAYIKNVNEKVDASLLKQTLFRFGKLKHFDVNRVKVRYFFALSCQDIKLIRLALLLELRLRRVCGACWLCCCR